MSICSKTCFKLCISSIHRISLGCWALRRYMGSRMCFQWQCFLVWENIIGLCYDPSLNLIQCYGKVGRNICHVRTRWGPAVSCLDRRKTLSVHTSREFNIKQSCVINILFWHWKEWSKRGEWPSPLLKGEFSVMRIPTGWSISLRSLAKPCKHTQSVAEKWSDTNSPSDVWLVPRGRRKRLCTWLFLGSIHCRLFNKQCLS